MPKLLNAFFACLILFSSSCKKIPRHEENNIDNTIIFGAIVDFHTNQPIEGVAIVYVFGSADLGTLDADTTILKLTDKEGKFQWEGKLTDIPNTYALFYAHYNGYRDYYLNVNYGEISESNLKLLRK